MKLGGNLYHRDMTPYSASGMESVSDNDDDHIGGGTDNILGGGGHFAWDKTWDVSVTLTRSILS